MHVQNAILESLQMKRNSKKAVTKEKKYALRKPQIALREIQEKNWISIAESKTKNRKKLISPKTHTRQINENSPRIPIENRTIIIFKNGDRFIGEVTDGLPHGYGTIVSLSGNVYAGEWGNGRPHGNGTHFWSDGTFYNGDWQNGAMHGAGAFFTDGEVVHGEWKNDRLVQIYNADSDSVSESFFAIKRRK